MNHPLRMDSDVRVLESLDSLPALPTIRKERECIARKLLEDGVVVSP